MVVRALKKEGYMIKLFLDKVKDALVTKYLMDTVTLFVEIDFKFQLDESLVHIPPKISFNSDLLFSFDLLTNL